MQGLLDTRPPSGQAAIRLSGTSLLSLCLLGHGGVPPRTWVIRRELAEELPLLTLARHSAMDPP